MRFDIGNLQAAVWQTEEAIDYKRLDLEHEDDAVAERRAVSAAWPGWRTCSRSSTRTLDFLIRQDGWVPEPPPGDGADALRPLLTEGTTGTRPPPSVPLHRADQMSRISRL